MFKVGIVGGTGYTGVELLRILSQHPSDHFAQRDWNDGSRVISQLARTSVA